MTMIHSKYFWFEFVEHLEERISSIRNEIESLLAHLEHLGKRREAFIYYEEFKSILETIGKSYEDLSKEEEIIEASVVPELRYLLAGTELKFKHFHDDIIRKGLSNFDILLDYSKISNLLNFLEKALAYLKYGIDQATGGEFLKQTIQYQYSFTSPLTDIPSWEKTLKAVSAVVYNYSELIFGQKWLKEHKIRPIAISGFGDYAILTSIYVAHYPIADISRARFWVSFGHEVQHEKNYIIDILYKNYKNYVKYQDKNYEEELRLIERKLELLFKDLKTFEKWKYHYNMNAISLINKLDTLYNASLAEMANNLLNEIVCDISNTLLSGPADFLSLISGYIPSMFGHSRTHPPLYLRFEYCLKVVEEFLKLRKFINEYSNVIDSLKNEFEKYLNYRAEKKDIFPIIHYDVLKTFVMGNFEELVELTKLSITSYLHKGNAIFFDEKKYQQAVTVKKGLSEGRSIEDISEELTGEIYGIEPRVVLMAEWLRRLDEFKEFENYPFDLFIDFRKYKSEFYPRIVSYLHGYYENKCRRW